MEVDQSGSTTQETQSDSVETDQTQDTVAYSTHKRLLGQRKNDLEQRRSLEVELQTFKEDARKREEAALLEQGKHKELADHYKTELQKTQEALTSRDEMINEGIKLQAFKSKIGGDFKNPKYMGLVDLDKIDLREDGTVDEGTLEMSVNNFKKEYGNDLITVGTGRRLPLDAARTAVTSEKKLEDMSVAELSARMKTHVQTSMTK